MTDDRPRARIPRRLSAAEGTDLRTLPLTPIDGFVLSRIDGLLDADDLVAATGLHASDVEASLEKLAKLGLVELEPMTAAPSRPSERDVEASPQSAQDPKPSPTRDTQAAEEAAAAAETAAALGGQIDLAPELREQVDTLYLAIETHDHYALLGVSRTAEKAAIKDAYYALASKLHPDRYFRKNLGAYKAKMEAVFARMTEAHDTLTRRAKREAYDEYLGVQADTRALEAAVSVAAADSSTDLEAEAARADVATAEEATPEPGPQDESRGTPAAPVPGQPSGPRRISSSAMAPAARRSLLAKRLLGGRVHPTPSPSATRGSGESKAEAREAVVRFVDQRTSSARLAKAKVHAAEAESAMTAGDPVRAIAAYRLAVDLVPTDARWKAGLEQASRAAEGVLSKKYVRQASFEETVGQWAQAARTWIRVTELSQTNAEAHARAASALLTAGVDIDRAYELARRATALAPGMARAQAALAQVAAAIGDRQTAFAAANAALRIAPDDGRMKTLLAELQSAD